MWVPKKTTREKRVEINFAPEIVVNDLMMISSFSEIWRRCAPSLSNVPLLFLVFSLLLFVFALISSKQTSSYVCSCSSSSRMISLIQNCNPKKIRKRKKQSNQFLAFSCCVGEITNSELKSLDQQQLQRRGFLFWLYCLQTFFPAMKKLLPFSINHLGGKRHERTGPQQSY